MKHFAWVLVVSVALWLAPSGQTVLIDSGSPGARDLDRLMEVIATAGVTRIDYLISAHYHVDHGGGLQELVKRIPVSTFVDQALTVEGPVAANPREQGPGFQAAYAELWACANHLVVKPGDTIPVAGLDRRIVASSSAALKVLIEGAPGAGQPNRAACAQTQPKDITGDPENDQSIGSVITLSGRGAGALPYVPAYWIEVTASADGSFTVANSRNNFSKTYSIASGVTP